MARNYGKTTVGNIALQTLGESTILDDLDTQDTPAAHSLRLFYPLALDTALMYYEWSFAADFTDKLPILERGPSSGYAFAYGVPDDFVVARQVGRPKCFVHNRVQFTEEWIPYKELKINRVTQIHTNLSSAAIEYTTNLGGEDALYPKSFVVLFGAVLAKLAGPGIITDDFAKIQHKLDRNIEELKITAIGEDVLRQSPTNQPVSQLITARHEGLVAY